MSWAPYIHPSGQYILFASNKLGFENFEVFLVDIDGKKEPVRVTYSDGFDGSAGAVARRPATGVDVEPRRRPEGRSSSPSGTTQTALEALRRRHSQGCRSLTRRREPMTRTLAGLVTAVALAAPSATLGANRSGARADTRAARRVPRLRRLDGRAAGSAGERLAGEYIAAAACAHRRQAAAGHADMFLPFEFTAGSAGRRIARSTIRRDGAAPRTLNDASRCRRSPSRTMAGHGPLVFAGYGLVVPELQNFGYDSYAGLDVKDKIVLVLRYFPEDAEPKVKADPRALLGSPLQGAGGTAARRQSDCSSSRAQLTQRRPGASMTFDTALAGSGIPAASISGRTARGLFDGAAKSLADAQQELDSGNPHVAGFALPATVDAHDARRAREADGAERRRLSAGDDDPSPAPTSRG